MPISENNQEGGESAAIFILAGEPSGDATGAALAKALLQQRPSLQLSGAGGHRMREAGVELVADSSHWGVIGVGDAFRKVFGVLAALAKVRTHLQAHPPDVFITIDAGAVNVRLLHQLQNLPSKKLYYMPPGSWSRKPRAGNLPELVDAIATPFPWSRDLLAGGRARVVWVGHPVLDTVQPSMTREQALARYGLDGQRPVVALAPGSREQELNYALPVLVQACALLAKKHTTAQFLAPVSAPAQEELVQRHFRQVGLELRLLKGVEPDAVQLADVAAVCSGTATLEFACLGVPMVVVYPTSMLTVFQYWLFRKLLGGHSYAGMPNIIADREIVKELLGPYAKPQAIADELDSLLCDRVKVEVMRNNLMEVRQALGEPGASARTAGLVLQLLAGNTPSEDLR